MTHDQQATVLANLEASLSAPLPPPLPKRRWVWLRWVLALSVVSGLYVYHEVSNSNAQIEKGLRLWDRTEVLIQTDPWHRPAFASCDAARDVAAKLERLQDDKLGNLQQRLETARELAAKAKLCVSDLAAR
jgi:hypothetical protein